VQSPQSGIALSHLLFWVLHRVQAFLAINGRPVLILLIDYGRITFTALYYTLAQEMCGTGGILMPLNAL
jgi:hypothetical protein